MRPWLVRELLQAPGRHQGDIGDRAGWAETKGRRHRPPLLAADPDLSVRIGPARRSHLTCRNPRGRVNMCAVSPLPSPLLHAVGERKRRIALIVGAGCSLEHPTNLKLAGDYSQDAYDMLVRDGNLSSGDCTDPRDLSALASAVTVRSGGQSALVKCLPRSKFRLAQANDGYLIAAALLREGVIETVMTLNFDLAMTQALVSLSATEVTVITGPMSADQLGGATLIYLHRSVEEEDLEQWILTVEALASQWQDGWESVVAARVIASPVLVFAGLGSPAAVLTTTVERVRKGVPDSQKVYVVDPSTTSAFEAALNVPGDAHIQMPWCAFAHELAARLLAEFHAELLKRGQDICTDNGWPSEVAGLPDLVDRFHAGGLVTVGRIRSRWLLDDQQYLPEEAHRGFVADLLLGVGVAERGTHTQARFREDGVVELLTSGIVATTVLPASGRGEQRWHALEARALQHVKRLDVARRPEHVLVCGAPGPSSGAVAPPEDLIRGSATDDIIDGFSRPRFVSADELRANPAAAAELVA